MEERAKVLDCVIEWKITEVQAWIELWVSDRQIRNLLKSYKIYGEEWLVHWLVWRRWNHRLTPEKEKVIQDIIIDEDFRGCKPIFITEKLDEIYWISVSKESVRERMIQNHVRIKREKKSHIYRIKRPRKEYYWEMSQFDWSHHRWLESVDEEYCLLLDIDDATGRIMHAKLTDNEWYENVAKFWQERIIEHWVPRNIYLDKFSTYKVNHKKATNTKDVRTNFDRSIRKLWWNLISANSPQAKWRVERCNGTLQDRLIKELRLVKITNVVEANKYIKEQYISKYNSKFWVESTKEGDVHIKINQEQIENLDRIFAKEELRSLWNDYIIQYKKNFYQIKPSKEYSIYPKKRLLVAKTLDWRIHIHAWKTVEEKLVNYELLDYKTVKCKRAKYYWEKHRIENERAKQLIQQRKKEKHRISKQKQIHYRVQRLISKI
jgi:hypothetical protein